MNVERRGCSEVRSPNNALLSDPGDWETDGRHGFPIVAENLGGLRQAFGTDADHQKPEHQHWQHRHNGKPYARAARNRLFLCVQSDEHRDGVTAVQ
ncbi:hypothetical protein PC116_g6922 [Phytophthora cactorum]|uniref:Uncharacterized protein n=1 Tax=Phytophthora cactorum TaxID=29920 RepID=A0A8T1ETL7_9STRA|nr:hypothetical protein Pcac1_g11331 [Phytophthora cactorum]KAG2924269.1 hypothetical protein PC114_g4547 [Phytophthora cactorum]KAG2955002.1 hypothetical protein PC117_g806 [Phytophthora cactorum]KAG3032420.1 hypothetical protein PC120_g2458 [Phytophthora cactorum]KAG3040338.1 hypothetical protein PC119_g1496 [Phytophthora cactorum]